MIKIKLSKEILILTIERLLNLLLVICGMIVVWIILQITCFTSFKIPSDSMEPILLAGDEIVVNKCILGGRLFNIWDVINGKDVNVFRLPAMGKIERNDILVFNFPYQSQWDSISFDFKSYYVKRCVALPGDTFEIEKGYYKVRGCATLLGNKESQDNLMSIMENNKEKDYGIVINGYPYNEALEWNIINFGPLYLPSKGDRLEMNPKHAILYKNLIEWEQKTKLSICSNNILLGDSTINYYRFKENYYFVAGDKILNSQDSRYWGLLPESFIVGKAIRIWNSVDINTKKIKWGRIFKKLE